MSFITGSANNVNEVLTALQNACTANGWTLSSGILSKGDCYVKAFINDGTIAMFAGTGQSGSNLLNAPEAKYTNDYWIPGYPNLWTSLSGIDNAITYPLIYNIHVLNNPDEVYLFINFNVDTWSYIAFGQSPTANLTGTGVWYGGTGIGKNILLAKYVGNESNNGHIDCALFSYIKTGGMTYNGFQQNKCFMHHAIADVPYPWSLSGIENEGNYNSASWSAMPSQASATLTLMPLLIREPSKWNSGAGLQPIHPSIIRPEHHRYIIGNIVHARYARIDYIDPGQIVTLGNEKWRFYPWIKKDINQPNPASNALHTGTYGVAIRYDGE